MRYTAPDGNIQAKLRFDDVTFPGVERFAPDGTGQSLLGDLNGDGLIDAWTAGGDKAIIWLNTGDNRFSAHHLFRPRPALQKPGSYRYVGAVLADFNADGRDDPLEMWTCCEQTSVQYSAIALLPDSLLTTLNPQDLGRLPFRVAGDLDNDGVKDLFGYPDTAYRGKGLRNTFLSEVVDGLGNVIDIDYDREVPTPAYTTDGRCSGDGVITWPEQCLKRMTGLVSRHTEGFISAVNGKPVVERTYTYSYVNGRMNVTGHGWLGFDQRSVSMNTAEQDGWLAVTDYEPFARYTPDGHPTESTNPPYLYPLAGLPKATSVFQFHKPAVPDTSKCNVSPLQTDSFDRRTTTENHWTVKQSAFGRPFPFTADRTTTTYDELYKVQIGPGTPVPEKSLELIECTTTFTPDDEKNSYGNITTEIEVCQPDSDHAWAAEKTTTQRSFETNPADWLITNPTSVEVTSQRLNDPSQTQSFAFTYQNGMLRTSSRAHPADDLDAYRKTTYLRDDFGNVRTLTTEDFVHNARVEMIDYDPDNVFPDTITNALQQKSHVAFDPRWGLPTKVVDPNEIAVRRAYDDFGHLGETHGPDGDTMLRYAASTMQTLDTAAGHIEPRITVTVERQGLGGTRSGSSFRDLDHFGRVVRDGSEGLGGVPVIQERAYDSLSRISGMTLAHAGNSTAMSAEKYSYDHLGRMTQLAHADGKVRRNQYSSTQALNSDLFDTWFHGFSCEGSADCPVAVAETIDEECRKNVVLTDHRGLIVRSIDGENVDKGQHTSDYFYGPFNRLVEAVDNLNNSTVFSYDPYGRRIRLDDPDSGLSKYSYNGYDELEVSLDPKGQTRTFQYDDLGRLKLILDNNNAKTQWIYDQGDNAIGRLSETISPATDQNPDGQHVLYTYEPSGKNNRGLLQTIHYRLDGTDYPVSFDHDDLARTTQIHYPNLGTAAPIVARYTYDTSGILTTVEEVGSSATKPLWHLDDAFQAHLVKHETFGNGATTAYDYDESRRWLNSIHTMVGPNPIQTLDYTHWDNGLIQNRTDAGATHEFLYDDLNRLEWVNDLSADPPTSVPYQHDDIGNLTSRGASVITFNPGNPHLVNTVDDNTYYTYDANGNLTNRFGPGAPGGAQTIDYTPFDLPSAIHTGADQIKTTRFEYSADEERLVRRDDDVTRYFIGDLYQRLVTTSTSDTVEERFRLYAGGRQLGEIVRKDGSDETLFFHADAIGTVDTISRGDQTFATQKFDIFGAPVDPPSVALTRAGFTGQQHDDDLGFIDMNGRIYDPLAARFTTADPVMQAPYWSQGLNRYAYAFNDPVNNVDPSGFISGTGDTAGDIATVGTLGTGFGTVGYGAVTGAWSFGIAGSAGASGIAGIGVGVGAGGAGLGGADLVNDISRLLDPSGQGHYSYTNPVPSSAPAATGGGQTPMNAVGQSRPSKVVSDVGEGAHPLRAKDPYEPEYILPGEECHAEVCKVTLFVPLPEADLQALQEAGSTVWSLLQRLLGRGAASAADEGASAAERVLDPNKLLHIFGKAGHNLSGLVQKLGSQEAAYTAVEKAIGEHVAAKGITGVFTESISVAGENITVRGAVVDGVARIGSFWVP